MSQTMEKIASDDNNSELCTIESKQKMEVDNATGNFVRATMFSHASQIKQEMDQWAIFLRAKSFTATPLMTEVNDSRLYDCITNDQRFFLDSRLKGFPLVQKSIDFRKKIQFYMHFLTSNAEKAGDEKAKAIDDIYDEYQDELLRSHVTSIQYMPTNPIESNPL